MLFRSQSPALAAPERKARLGRRPQELGARRLGAVDPARGGEIDWIDLVGVLLGDGEVPGERGRDRGQRRRSEGGGGIRRVSRGGRRRGGRRDGSGGGERRGLGSSRLQENGRCR